MANDFPNMIEFQQMAKFLEKWHMCPLHPYVRRNLLHILSLFYAIATPGEQHHQSGYSISVGHVSSTDNRCYTDFSNKYTFLIPCIILLVKGARECNQ
jgi:hypothetical protein